MVHIDPFLCKLGPKIAFLEVLPFFPEILQHSLLILIIEFPDIFNWKSGGLSESVKKGKFVTKIFLSDNVE